MNRAFEIALEIAKRPHLWDTENPKILSIVRELQREGIYKRTNATMGSVLRGG